MRFFLIPLRKITNLVTPIENHHDELWKLQRIFQSIQEFNLFGKLREFDTFILFSIDTSILAGDFTQGIEPNLNREPVKTAFFW